MRTLLHTVSPFMNGSDENVFLVRPVRPASGEALLPDAGP